MSITQNPTHYDTSLSPNPQIPVPRATKFTFTLNHIELSSYFQRGYEKLLQE